MGSVGVCVQGSAFGSLVSMCLMLDANMQCLQQCLRCSNGVDLGGGAAVCGHDSSFFQIAVVEFGESWVAVDLVGELHCAFVLITLTPPIFVVDELGNRLGLVSRVDRCLLICGVCRKMFPG